MAGADLLQQLPQLEAMCQRLYTAQAGWGLPSRALGLIAGTPEPGRPPQAPQERAAAEQLLRVFGQSTNYVAHCKVRRPRLGRAGWGRVRGGTGRTCAQAILDNSRSAYAQLLAASSLLKVVTEQTLR